MSYFASLLHPPGRKTWLLLQRRSYLTDYNKMTPTDISLNILSIKTCFLLYSVIGHIVSYLQRQFLSLFCDSLKDTVYYSLVNETQKSDSIAF